MSPIEARAALTERMAELTGRGQDIAVHLRGEDGRLEADFGDVGNFVAEDEVLEGLEVAAIAEIAEILSALERLEAGIWGTCTACGDDIAPQRLGVLPHTRLCVVCAARAGG